MNTYRLLSRYLDFFAAGDAVGKATEFITLAEIRNTIVTIKRLISHKKSKNNSDLMDWEVTDDTEQNLFLLRRYLNDHCITIQNTVDALVEWINTTGAVEKKYIGPSSLKALNGIKAGDDPNYTGINGTTCGGIMRTPSAVFSSLLLDVDMDEAIHTALLPTHNNSVAYESAYAYGYALKKALDGGCKQEVIEAAKEGCRIGISKAPWIRASSSLLSRISFLEKLNITTWTERELSDFLYGVYGTGLPSYETAGAVFAIFLYTSDPLEAIYISAGLGGDTDTIGALAASLLSVVNRDVELPEDVINPIKSKIDLEIK